MLTDFPPCIPIFWRFVPLKWFGSEVSSGQIEVQLRLFTTNVLLPKDLVAMWVKRNESHSSIFASCICLRFVGIFNSQCEGQNAANVLPVDMCRLGRLGSESDRRTVTRLSQSRCT